MATMATVHVIIVILLSTISTAQCLGDHGRLIDHLLSDYDVRARPVYDASTQTEVHLTPFLRQVVSLDIISQILTTKMSLKMSWYDEFLKWNVSEFGGIETLELPGDQVWKPSVLVSNSVSVEFPHYGFDRESTVVVMPDGQVFYRPMGIFETTCGVNVADYPFDTQVCDVRIAYFYVYAEEVNLTVPISFINKGKTYSLAIEDFTESSEWNLQNFTCQDKQFKAYRSWRKKRTTTNSVVCEVKLKRRALFYIFNLVMPCLVLLVIGVISFFVPISDSSDRISLTVTLLLAMMVFLLVLMDRMPPTSSAIPLMEEFVGGCTICLGLSTAIAVVFSYFNSLDKSRPPSCIRWIIARNIPKYLCVNMDGLKQADEDRSMLYTKNDADDSNENELQILNGRDETKKGSQEVTSSDGSRMAAAEWQILLTLVDRLCLIMYTIAVIALTIHFFSHS